MSGDAQTFAIHRKALLLGPGLFFALSAIVLVSAPDAGTRIFYALMTLATGYWLVRARRVTVLLTATQLVVRGQFRTRHFPWTEIQGADLTRMRTASPFAGRWPYLALAVTMVDGERRQFEEVAAPAANAAYIEEIAAAIRLRTAQ